MAPMLLPQLLRGNMWDPIELLGESASRMGHVHLATAQILYTNSSLWILCPEMERMIHSLRNR